MWWMGVGLAVAGWGSGSGAGALGLALGGGAAAFDLGQEVGAFGVLEVNGAEGERALFFGEGREAEVDDLGFDAGVAAFEPDAADEVVEQARFVEALGAVLVRAVAGELVEAGGLFAGAEEAAAFPSGERGPVEC